MAVRVSTTDASMPGGLCDNGALAQNGVSVASGSDWQPPSPFDPARSPNGRSYGYSVDGAAWVNTTACNRPFSLGCVFTPRCVAVPQELHSHALAPRAE